MNNTYCAFYANYFSHEMETINIFIVYFSVGGHIFNEMDFINIFNSLYLYKGHYAGSGSTSKSYAYESQPYQYDYGSPNGHGYEPGPAPGHGYSSSGEAGVPYHVYRPRPEPGHYPGPPLDYSYSSYPIDSHEIVSHKGSPELSPKALLAKSFLIPLASATVLGIAAALISNPLLLQLAPVPGIGVGVGIGPSAVGKRRRRRQAVKLVPRSGSYSF